jgi:Rrf2 family protein
MQAMFSQTAEYALRAMVMLAEDSTAARTSEQIAMRSRIPLDYLSKVLQALARSGLLTAKRGPGGGFVLSRPAAEVCVLDVINSVDPIRRIRSCPLGIEAHGTTLCPLHRKLDDAMRSIEEVFGAASLADLVSTPISELPQCEEGGLCHA